MQTPPIVVPSLLLMSMDLVSPFTYIDNLVSSITCDMGLSPLPSLIELVVSLMDDMIFD